MAGDSTRKEDFQATASNELVFWVVNLVAQMKLTSIEAGDKPSLNRTLDHAASQRPRFQPHLCPSKHVRSDQCDWQNVLVSFGRQMNNVGTHTV